MPALTGRARGLSAAMVAVAVLALVVAIRVSAPWSLPAALPTALPSGGAQPLVGDAARARAEHAGIDVDALAGRLSHGITRTGTGMLSTGDARYRATFGPAGFTMTPAGQAVGLTVGLVTAQRDGPTSHLASARWTADANEASRARGSGFVERVTAGNGSVEWDVVVAHRPAGSGSLRLVASLTGAVGARRTSDAHGPGWALTLAGGGRVRLGELVIKDRDGRVVAHALPAVVGSRLTLSVPAAVVDAARYPLVIDPTVSADQPVGTVAAPGAQQHAVVAWSGTQYLVAWSDDQVDGLDFMATRVTGAGGVLDPKGIPIPTGHFGAAGLAVASNGTDFLLAWSEPRSGTHQQDDVFGTRVSAAGAVLDPTTFTIASAAFDESSPSIAWNGTSYFVAWGGSQLGGTRINSAGTVLNPSGIVISSAAGSQALPSVASDGSTWLVVWDDTRAGDDDVYRARINNAGTVLSTDVPVVTGSSFQTNPSVAWNGTHYLVVWVTSSAGIFMIEAKRLDNVGTPIESSPIPLSTGIYGNDPAVTANGTSFLVTWTGFNSVTSTVDVVGQRVNDAGTVLDGAGFTIASPNLLDGYSAVASNGTSSLVLWQAHSGTIDIDERRVAAAGTLLDAGPRIVSTAVPTHFEWSPAVAWNGTEFLVVWEDGRSNVDEDVYGTLVDAKGAVLDPTGIPISTVADGQYEPAVASNGTDFLVTWEDFRSGSTYDIYGTRVTASGKVVTPAGTAISTAADDQNNVAVGWNGTNYIVAWTDHRSGTSEDVYGTRVTSAGSVVTPAGTAFSTATGDQSSPAVASTGGTTLVVWNDTRLGGPDIYGTRVSTTGARLDAAGIAISTATGSQAAPAVAWNGTSYFVAWTDGRNGTDDNIYGTRVNSGGSVLAATGIPVSTAPGPQNGASIAGNGNFLVAWRDGRSGNTYDIYATRIDGNGVVQDTSGIPVAASNAVQEISAAVAAGPGTGWGVAHAESQFNNGQGTYFSTVAPK